MVLFKVVLAKCHYFVCTYDIMYHRQNKLPMSVDFKYPKPYAMTLLFHRRLGITSTASTVLRYYEKNVLSS